MDQDDPQKRIADLERQLAGAKAAAREDQGVPEEPAPPYGQSWRDPTSYGAPPGFVAFPPETGIRRLHFRVSGKLIALIVVPLMLGWMTSAAIPESALWMSRILCSSPYHLNFDPDYEMGSGSTHSFNNFQCVNFGSVHPVSQWTITAVQAMLIALVLWAAAAIGFLIWRLSQKRWLTSTVVAVGSVVPLAAVFAYGVASVSPGPKQLQSADGLSALLALTRNRFGDTTGYELRVSSDDIATLWRPDPQSDRLKKSYSYIPGRWNGAPEGAWRASDSTKRSLFDQLADLSKFDVTAVTARLAGAARALGLTEGTGAMLDIKNYGNGGLSLSITVNGPEDGSMDLNPDGSVKALHPPS